MRRPFAIHAATLSVLLVAGVAAVAARPARADDDLAERVMRSKEVYTELMTATDRGVPQELRENAKAIVVLPHVIKGAIGIGARFGKGVVTVRDASGQWSPVAFVHLTGGSWGLQLGAEAADVVLFFMTDNSVRSLLASKFTLGAKAGMAAGPLGRTAEASTDLKLNAAIYSYAKTKGLFAGISLEGARLAVDNESTGQYYGAPVPAKQVLFDRSVPKRPAEMEAFLQALK